jgi:hypothetical protein
LKTYIYLYLAIGGARENPETDSEVRGGLGACVDVLIYNPTMYVQLLANGNDDLRAYVGVFNHHVMGGSKLALDGVVSCFPVFLFTPSTAPALRRDEKSKFDKFSERYGVPPAYASFLLWSRI